MSIHNGATYTTPGLPLLTINGACAALVVSRRTIYRLVSQGDLVAVRVGERLRFRPEDIERYLEERREPVSTP